MKDSGDEHDDPEDGGSTTTQIPTLANGICTPIGVPINTMGAMKYCMPLKSPGAR
jgi:hypothetical protein